MFSNYEVRQVTNNDETMLRLVTEEHYTGRRPSISYAFTLTNGKGEVIGALTYGKPASNPLCVGVCGEEYSKHVYELNRLILTEDAPKNSSSFFIARAEKLLRTHGEFIIVSYSDTGMNHHGFTYQASNFLYTGATAERTDKYVPSGKHSRHYDDSEDTVHLRKVRTSKHRYVKFVGSKTFRKRARQALNYEVLPYPKGDNGSRYELGTRMKTKVYNRLTGEYFVE